MFFRVTDERGFHGVKLAWAEIREWSVSSLSIREFFYAWCEVWDDKVNFVVNTIRTQATVSVAI